MVYVRNDGTVSTHPPIHERILRFLFGIISFSVFFFKSLLGLDTTKPSSHDSRGSFFTRFGGGGGGGGGGGSGGGGGPGGKRPFGPGRGGGGPNIRTMGDINRPTVSAGGCPGGSCGM